MPPLDSFNISCVLLYISLTNPSPQLMISFSHPSTMLFATVIAMSRKLVPHANVRLPPADDVSPIQLNVQQQQQLQPLPFLNWSLQVLELADGFCRVVVITAIPSTRRFHQTTPYPTPPPTLHPLTPTAKDIKVHLKLSFHGTSITTTTHSPALLYRIPLVPQRVPDEGHCQEAEKQTTTCCGKTVGHVTAYCPLTLPAR